MSHQQITFRVPYSITQAVIAWQQMVSWHIVTYQINTFGFSRIVRYMDHKRFTKLDKIPEFGTAEPYYGMVGGGYRYSFQPDSDGNCLLTITSSADKQQPRLYDKPMPPLKLWVPNCMALRPVDAAFTLFSPHVISEHTVTEASVDEMQFWIHMDWMPRLLQRGWTEETAVSFQYTFVPHSVGCEIFVSQSDSDEEYHLTEGANW